MSAQPSQAEFAPLVRAVFDELDMQQLAIFRRLSGARRIQMISEMCSVLRKVTAASILARDPGISPQELNRRVVKRIQMTYAH